MLLMSSIVTPGNAGQTELAIPTALQQANNRAPGRYVAFVPPTFYLILIKVKLELRRRNINPSGGDDDNGNDN